jgi:hypothetical protein
MKDIRIRLPTYYCGMPLIENVIRVALGTWSSLGLLTCASHSSLRAPRRALNAEMEDGVSRQRMYAHGRRKHEIAVDPFLRATVQSVQDIVTHTTFILTDRCQTVVGIGWAWARVQVQEGEKRFEV